MKLPPLQKGKILRRYKRFLADIELPDGAVVTAHCPNTGRMTGCWEPGAAVEISYSDNPKRKLAWTLERVDMGQGWVGVNTARTNAVVAEAIQAGKIPRLQGYAGIKGEVKFEMAGHPSSRLDLRLTDGVAPDALIEVKSVTLWDGERLRFPDAVSERARKHMKLLQAAVEAGLRGVVIFALNRPEGECFSPAGDIDPKYAEALAEALAAGVEAYALRIDHLADGMQGGELIPVLLELPSGQ